MPTYQEYLGMVDRARRDNPEWRYGQAFFNVLHRVRPDLSEKVRSTPIDPFYFYTFNKVHPFLKFVEQNW